MTEKSAKVTSPNNMFSLHRRAGVLLHPTSLPGMLSNGDFGHEAYRFIEFLHANQFKVWQMLPLGPTLEDKSPYQSLSAHAGNPHLISLDWLVDKGWLDKEHINLCESQATYRHECLKFAATTFYQSPHWFNQLELFRQKNDYWLRDFALFMALKQKYNGAPWYEWPRKYRHRDETSLQAASEELQIEIKQIIFEQFVFFTQWSEIKAYANKHEVELYGDMPIFMGVDSADVWAHHENFLIDQDGNQTYVSGVPPDAFSDTGQRWGNPLYNWEKMQEDGFAWWKQRFKTQLELFDIIRLDHFRGLEACWYIPANQDTAENGFWQKVPGDSLLKHLFEEFESLPLIAEDLGVITDEVIALKDKFNLPGMRVLQFAFDANNQNPHLPHNYTSQDVVYTGTHDNDTTMGWLNSRQYHIAFLNQYLGRHVIDECMNCEQFIDENNMLSIIQLAMSSVAFLCVIPMQDILALGTEARMNIPGTVENNWLWRFNWDQVKPEHLQKIQQLIEIYAR